MRNLRFALVFLTLMLTVTAIVAAQEPPAPETSEASAPQVQEAPAPEAPAQKESEVILRDPDTEGTLVVTGQAVNASPDEIILETEDGRRVFVVDSESLYPEPIAEGQTVTVWYVERANHLYATALEAGDPLHPESLPRTASPEALYIAASLVAFLGAVVLWRVRKASEQ